VIDAQVELPAIERETERLLIKIAAASATVTDRRPTPPGHGRSLSWPRPCWSG
jgi:hypothetical protein